MAVFDSIKCQRRYHISLFHTTASHVQFKKSFKKAMIFFLFSENHRLYLFMTYNITENFTLQTPALTFLLEFTCEAVVWKREIWSRLLHLIESKTAIISVFIRDVAVFFFASICTIFEFVLFFLLFFWWLSAYLPLIWTHSLF